MDKNKTKITGLITAEVAERIKSGKVNIVEDIKTKSLKKIFCDNIFTLFNAINLVLFIALVLVGSYKNILFMGVVISNIVIGVVQEIRSKISVDKLTILSEKHINVLRNGVTTEISKNNIVLDDIIILSRGDQIPADCVVCDGECKVNESLLTGESDLISKTKGSDLLSGSFITAGKCFAKVTKVGMDCYAAKINNEAKYIKKVNSQILNSFNFIIKICTFVLFPIGICFFIRQFGIQDGNIQTTIVSTVAALVGMIPKGMILLTSTVLAVSIIRLSSKNVLVQEMYCIETLARVDVLCMDKTGTLTADEMSVDNIISLNGNNDCEINKALASIVESSDEINATLFAVKDYTHGVETIKCEKFIPFSSETKWSGGTYEDGKTYIIGAAEFVLKDKQKYDYVFEKIQNIKTTVRVILLASSQTSCSDGTLPDDLQPMALVLIKDKLRDNVKQTINYFKQQGVALKVISGDSVKTVQNIALETGVDGAEKAVDMTTITNDLQLEKAALECNVFGRVTPAQKKKLVLALKKHGHSVAMTGDGVNDVLALKEADCSVAMASGSDAARNVSQLVLVNNDFASMPYVVAEGRRTINNLESSSALYLVKTIYSIILSIFFIFFNMQYPFQPIQLTLISTFTVALPSFVLALQPNNKIIKGNFTANIIARALPAAICTVTNIISSAIICKLFQLPNSEFSTICVLLTAVPAILLVIRMSVPFNAIRTALIIVSISGVTLGTLFFGWFFSLVPLSFTGLATLIGLSALTIILFNILYNFSLKYIQKIQNKHGEKNEN